MDVEITVKGSVICYLKDDFWHLIFVTDETHLVKFSIDNKAGVKELRHAGFNRSITFDFNGEATPKAEKGDDFGKILNIARKEMHGKNKIKVARKFKKGREIIQMIIPVGTLDYGDPTYNYHYREVKRNTKSEPLDGEVASCIKINIKSKSKNLSMIIVDGSGTTITPLQSNTKLSLNFDNDCGDECKGENDFNLYYDWLQDADNKRFIAGKGPQLIGKQGNCDPITVDPPPED